MAETLLSIDGVTFDGDDITVFQVDSFSWSASDGLLESLRTLTVLRPQNELSPLVVALFQSGESRGAVLTCTDDAGAVRLRLDLTEATVTTYSVTGGGAGEPLEQLTLSASSVEMTCGNNFVDV
jgi:hypothetical protein